jgi:hypothetical protein
MLPRKYLEGWGEYCNQSWGISLGGAIFRRVAEREGGGGGGGRGMMVGIVVKRCWGNGAENMGGLLGFYGL